MSAELDDAVGSFDRSIAIIEQLVCIDPHELAAMIVERAARDIELSENDRLLVHHAALLTYNAIVGGAALAATVA